MAKLTWQEAQKYHNNPEDLLAILVSGQNPDGTPFTLDIVGNTTSAATALAELWTNDTLLATNGNVASGWLDVSAKKDLLIGRIATGGAYAFEVDWARANPGAGAADLTEVVAVANNTTVVKPVGMAWARFRARNTDAVTAMTVHRTVVSAR